ncbi:peptide deformylase [Paenibacillus albicereus]|uniref:Peptide deformylase n=1 Tax=Paenibacillus albicereus TaxID=2726185 RepID=A0A6H2GY66_9BACL|nr:peptide deformylase [Paenibacillus albicereus]QJC52332.1 peptide deformylase [Paenibacillus albicereus]
MTVRTIVPFGESALRSSCRDADPTDPRTHRQLDDLRETLYAKEGRAGLAAPQIGLLRRLIVIDVGDGLVELINPQLIRASGEQTGTEGCLSLPGYYGFVKRAMSITVRTMRRSGETAVLEAEGGLARCIQHEMDHLNGVLYVDHIQDGWLYEDATGRQSPLVPFLALSRGQGARRV